MKGNHRVVRKIYLDGLVITSAEDQVRAERDAPHKVTMHVRRHACAPAGGPVSPIVRTHAALADAPSARVTDRRGWDDGRVMKLGTRRPAVARRNIKEADMFIGGTREDKGRLEVNRCNTGHELMKVSGRTNDGRA